MEKDLSYNIAKPPPEVKQLLGTIPESRKAIGDWYSFPNREPITTRVSQKELMERGAVDAYELMSPFLKNRILTGSLRTMDFLNGCGRHCDTCYVASMFPTKIFTFDSLDRLFSDKRFIRILQPDIRIGSVGDIEDHPDAVEITKMILAKTPGKRLKIFTNYRPKDEEKMDGLIHLARNHGDRFRLVISLPFNRTMRLITVLRNTLRDIRLLSG